jgi:glycerol kinase
MGRPPTTLRVDGGMVANDWLCQFLADILDVTVERPAVTETTALGAAFLAGLHAGVFGSVDVIRRVWESERRFTPAMADAERQRLHQGWLRAVGRVRTG